MLVLWKGTTPAKIAESPASVFGQSILIGVVDHVNEVDESSCSVDGVSIEDAVAGDVADGPDSLFDYSSVI